MLSSPRRLVTISLPDLHAYEVIKMHGIKDIFVMIFVSSEDDLSK